MIVAGTNEYDKETVITGIAGKKGFSVLTVEKAMMNAEIGFGRRILDVLEDNDISFEHLPSGVDTMSVVVHTSDLDEHREKVITSLNKRVRPDSVVCEDGLALLAVVGRGMVKAKGTAARVFYAISNAGINIRMIDQGSSELNIIVGVEEHDLEKALNAIYHEFVKV
jgi:aspartate kinase